MSKEKTFTELQPKEFKEFEAVLKEHNAQLFEKMADENNCLAAANHLRDCANNLRMSEAEINLLTQQFLT